MNDFTRLTDLASSRLGGCAVAASDEFFGPREALVRPEPPRGAPDRYTDHGKWVDGWETRRRRDAGHDWCVIRLGVAGVVRGVDVDTTHFLGNHAPEVTIDAAELDGDEGIDAATWTPLLPRTPLQAGGSNPIAVAADGRFTHLRLDIHPDGGIARLRVHGEPRPDWARLAAGDGPIELAGAARGGIVVDCSDAFFGAPHQLLLPDASRHMGDGWETRRRRAASGELPGHDWCVIRLGHRARLEAIEIDTIHFKGNYPDRCGVDGLDAPGAGVLETPAAGAGWRALLDPAPMRADAVHRFTVTDDAPCTHVRLCMHPDGGVSRLRVMGRLVDGTPL